MILGRQPELGLAELESLYGPDKVRPAGDKAAIIEADPSLVDFRRLGGSVKCCELLTTFDTTGWKAIEKFLIGLLPGDAEHLPEGKMRLGLSVIGLDVGLRQLEATGLSLKKAIRKTGRNVRLVPNKSHELNTAQILHNQLTGRTGREFVLIRDGRRTIVARTVDVQDIESYTRRDRGRPKRDAKVGMLPPKLAQIIINLAAGTLLKSAEPRLDKTLLDPFCGTGVVLQEAALMGYDVYGTDVDERMIEYSRANLEWLGTHEPLPAVCSRLETADATRYTWKPPVDLVAGETYLGRPFTSRPDSEILARTISDCNQIISKFLKNLHGQLAPDTRLCLALPAWHISQSGFKQLPLIDQIENIGYNWVSFEHVGSQDLIYHREDQIVARRLAVIIRK